MKPQRVDTHYFIEGVGYVQADVYAKLHPNYPPSEFGSKTGEIEHMADETKVQKAIFEICNEIRETLLDKNRKYGNSALEPVRVFSDAPPDEQIRVRIDDKISRLRSGQVDDDEDVILDLIGYLTLLLVYRRNNEQIPVQTDYDC